MEASLLRAVEDPDTSLEQLRALARELESLAMPSPSLLRKLETIARAVASPGRQRRLITF